ncbi:MAG: VOC family protein [Candidatus Helarchaeota archaeon]|nr:VOC family protein [Candidatus Helarchaeota archaeon]
MNFNRIEHIAALVEDVEKHTEGLKKVLGIKTVPTLDWKISEDLDGNPIDPYTLRVAFFKMKNIVLELMEVVEGKSFYDKFKEKVGQGIHHVCFDVEDIKGEIKKFGELGIKVTQSGKFAGSSFAYLDTEELCGFQLEMLQKRTRAKRKK